jgi:hypothetical protein
MNRRGFIASLSLLPLAVKGFLSGRPQVVGTPIGSVSHRAQIYCYIQAANTLRVGQPVYEGTQCVGFAAGNISRGHYGFMLMRMPERMGKPL